MEFTEIGKLIKEIRTAKKLSQKDVSGDYLSVSLLSKFERGDSEISISRFLSLLNNLDVSIEEFYGILSKTNATYTENLLDKVSDAFYTNNLLALKKYKNEALKKYQTTGKKQHLYHSIMIDSFIASVTDDEVDSKLIQTLTDYLFGVEQWGKSELIILGNSMNAITTKTLDLLMKEILYRTTLFSNSSENKHAKIIIIINAVSVFLDRNELKYAKFYLDILSNLPFPEVFLYERLEYKFVTGKYMVLMGNIESGFKLIEEMLHCLKELGADKLFITRENNYLDLRNLYHI